MAVRGTYSLVFIDYVTSAECSMIRSEAFTAKGKLFAQIQTNPIKDI